MTERFNDMSMNGRMAYIIMCVEAYLVNRYPDNDWTVFSKLMWKATSMNWADWSDLYSRVMPDVFLQYEQYSAEDMGNAISEKDFHTVKELFGGITEGREDDPEDELNIILNKPFEMATVYEGTVIGDGKESINIIHKTEQILKNNGIALPDCSKVLFSSIEERNGRGNDFYGEYLSIVLTKEPDLSDYAYLWITEKEKWVLVNTDHGYGIVNKFSQSLLLVSDDELETAIIEHMKSEGCKIYGNIKDAYADV